MRFPLLTLTVTLCSLSSLAGCAHDGDHKGDSPAVEEADASGSAAAEEPPTSEDAGLIDTAADAVASSGSAAVDELPESEDDGPGEIETSESTGDAPPATAVAAASLPGTALPEDCTFETTASGLKIAVLEKGEDGNGCLPTDTVTVHYAGYLTDGKRFDGTNPGEPATFPAGGLIQGWQEALGLMTPGSKVKIVIPWNLAYGEQGYPGVIPPKADLVFDMELVSVKEGPKPLPVPPFERPADDTLTTTGSGLQQKVVVAGSGASPAATDTVSVHYAGWLTDGTLFDNSYARGEPASFPLNRVIPGWTEGLQLMQEGGTSIFVIPSDLAYGESGAGGTIPPNATLVFRVELLSIDG
ncbi:MAG: FKBP-type peptidyl-prolyl cis-trans isomerase [Planctomycetota bacterium]|jgi:peptidylprolyl isomerase